MTNRRRIPRAFESEQLLPVDSRALIDESHPPTPMSGRAVIMRMEVVSAPKSEEKLTRAKKFEKIFSNPFQ